MSRNAVSASVLLVVMTSVVFAQTPPPRPRLLFPANQLSSVQSRALTPGTPASDAYASMVTSVSLSVASNPLDWSFSRNIRRMQEVALRYRITGDTNYAANAKVALMSLTNGVAPTGNNGPYQLATYPCAIAIGYDLLYNQLSTSERATIVSKLEQWVNALQVASNAVGPYSAYGGATDNYSFAWSAGIAMSLLAIWGETNRPNLLNDIQSNMQRIQSGWNDAVSPDGSIDESYGYANYSTLWALRAAIACENCGLGDYMTNSNVLKTSRWLGRSLVGNEFPWTGDSSPSHKGLRLDPIVYFPIQRTLDAEALEGIQRIFALEPVSDSSVTWGFSPYITILLRYPLGLTPTRPAVGSAFFRDNRNEAPAAGNKTNNFFGIGLGGHAFLHNDTGTNDTPLSAFFNIRDEWMNHAHEDDGHIVMGSGGVQQYIDRGYSGTSAAQSGAHNIVVVNGAAGFAGNSNNYYSPPGNEGRFYGERKASFFSKGFDYVRGDHRTMWQMTKAERTLAMIKDQNAPYAILIDVVNRDGGTNTYDEVFHSSSSAAGSGNASDPMRVVRGSQTLRAVWLSPSAVSVLPGSAVSGGGITAWPNKVRATGVEVAFVSLHGGTAPNSTSPLPSPGTGTAGGIAHFGGYQDRILVRRSGAAITDANTQGDGQMAWIRKNGNIIQEWCVAEASSLSHSGTTLLLSNAQVTASARRGRVEIDILDGTLPADLMATLHVPFSPSEVLVNGLPANYSALGATVTIGTASTSISTQDRFYAFANGDFWDAQPTSNLDVNGDERLYSTNGWGSLTLRGGALNPVRPIAFGMRVHFDPSVGGVRSVVKFETTPSAGDVLTLNIGREGSVPNHFRLEVLTTAVATTPVATFDVPFSVTPNIGRFVIVLNPATGAVDVYDSGGPLIGSTTVFPTTAAFRTRVIIAEGIEVDDITYFDSEEDGQSPRGVAFWVSPGGRAGFAMRAPSVCTYSMVRLRVGNMYLDPVLTVQWMTAAGFYPTSLYTSPSGGVPGLDELVWEATSLAAPPNLVSSLLIEVTQPSGMSMASQAYLP